MLNFDLVHCASTLGGSTCPGNTKSLVSGRNMLTVNGLIALRPFKTDRVPLPARAPEWPVLRARAPLDIEIGCGVGLHPIEHATQNPDREIIAIEHTKSRFASFSNRITGHPQLTNLHPIHANAIGWISHRIQGSCVDTYFLLYPNPYPKHEHRNRRWYAMPFTRVLIDTLKPGGRIVLATNIDSYAREAKAAFEALWGLHCVEESRPARPGRTHFEIKYLERGENCINLIFEKKNRPIAAAVTESAEAEACAILRVGHLPRALQAPSEMDL